jgi:PleD family two-component response regulator
MGPLDVTISLGVAEAAAAESSLAELLDAADRGLLAAKRQGRDRVVAIDSESGTP